MDFWAFIENNLITANYLKYLQYIFINIHKACNVIFTKMFDMLDNKILKSWLKWEYFKIHWQSH